MNNNEQENNEVARSVDEEKTPDRYANEPLTDDDMPPCTSMMGHQLSPFNDEDGGPQTRMACMHCNETRLVTPGDLKHYLDTHEYPPWCVKLEDTDSNQPKEGNEEQQKETNLYHVTVYHTGTLTGAPDLHEEQVSAKNEQQAIKRAKNRSGWPENEYYEDEDVEVKEL